MALADSGKLHGGWQTAGVVFVADALGGWLVEQLADAGRKKLTELILGSEQERALRRAADAAVWATAEEMSPSGGEQAGQVAMVISEVFRDPVPDAPLAGPVMLLEGLQAGIAGQLAVLDDAELTGTGQSSADVLGVPGTVLADRLTGHLVREIIVRGSGGGPLTPLADQLNHELTRLQIGGMLARLAGEVRDALARPDSDVTVAGRPLEEVTDPFVLEVHRPVQPEDAPPGLPVLPPYVPREHDEVLGQVVRAAAEGRSGIAVLVGGSSTGKTRACWEALALLRDQDPPWRLWHPIDPSRPDAALRELPGIGPRTVVWLNEAQFYLDPAEAGLGERVAAGLRELLRDPGRAPVLVLATVWPRFWDALTARPAGGDDRHAQARELLAGHDITVPAAFTPAQMGQLARAADVRMVLAARSAPDGEVIQFLAGAPELLARYRNAPPAAAALIGAAMDARRLGMGAGLPQAFLEAAAPGYLTDAEWDALGEDWLEQALAYTAVPCKGARGPLTRIRPRPASRAARDRGDQPGSMAAAAGPLYRLADYLDQHGRAHRASQIPPAEFWSAAAAHAAPGDQAALGDAAHARGLYRDAAQLHKNAAASGNTRAAFYLSRPPACLRADPRPAHWAAAHAALDDPGGRGQPAGQPAGGGRARAGRRAGRPGRRPRRPRRPGRRGLPAGQPAAGGRARAGRRAGWPATRRPRRPRRPGRRGQPAGQPAAGGRARAGRRAGRPGRRPRRPRRPGRRGQPAGQPAARRARTSRPPRWPAGPPPTPPSTTRTAWPACWTACGRRARTSRPPRWLARTAAHAPLDDPGGVASLLDSLRQAGAHEQAAALAGRAAAHAALDDPGGVASLLDSLREAGADEQAAALLARDPPPTPPSTTRSDVAEPAGQPAGGGRARAGRRAGWPGPAAHAPLDDPGGVARLLDSLREAGAHEQAAALADRAAAHAALDDPDGVASLLDSLRQAGAHEQAAALLARDPAAHAALDDPGDVASLLDSLRQAGAHEQAAALLARDPAAHAALDDPGGVASLLDSLREAGAHEQAAALADRAAAHAALDDPRRRGQPAGQPAGGGRARAGRRAGRPGRRPRHPRYLRPVAAQAIPVLGDRGVASLLDSLRQAARTSRPPRWQVGCRRPACSGSSSEQKGLADQFRFGREADGTPAAPWGWEDLDLWLVPRSRRQATRGAALSGVPRRDRPARPRCASDPATASASPDRERRPPRRAQRGRPPK